MIQELDTPKESRWFASVMLMSESTAGDPRLVRRRRDDTRMEVLAHEIALYMPELARALVKSGRRKLLAA